METNPSDIALLGQIAAQDSAAFRLFYERYAARVLAYVRAMGRGREQTEDVVQEVFLAVWRKAASFRRDRGDVPGWLYTITRNKLVDLWRQRPVGSDPVEADLARLPTGETWGDESRLDQPAQAARRAQAGAATGSRARLLRRAHLRGDRRAARSPGRYPEIEDPRRTRADARTATGRRTVSRPVATTAFDDRPMRTE
ncbi:MAG: sigma-70 family RNA polymerase sigma factor [Thermoanaerobaculia bacterium]